MINLENLESELDLDNHVRKLIEEARTRASSAGEVVGLASRVTPLSHGKDNREIKAEVPFEVYLKKRFLVGSYLGISLPVSKTLVLGRVNAVERSDILAVSKVPALSPIEDASGIATYLALTIELLSEEVDGEVVPPSSPVDPQSPIFVPNEQFIKKMLGLPEKGTEIGRVMEGYKETRVEVRLTHDILRHHMLVVGTTGAGKTNFLKLIAKNSEVPTMVFDIQGDYVKTVAEMGGTVIVPITREYANHEIIEFLDIFLKRTNMLGYMPKELNGNKIVMRNEAGNEFTLYLTAFLLSEIYQYLPEVSPFFTPQGASYFKTITRDCITTIDQWEEDCSNMMNEMRIHKLTQDSIIRTVGLLKETGIIDVKIPGTKGRSKRDFFGEPNYEDVMKQKSVIDLRWALEEGTSSATISAFLVSQRIFERVDKIYKTESKETPFLMIFDEAHEYFPQGRREEDKEGLERLINRILRLGRVRGIGTVLATHRPTDLNRLILTLTNTKVAMRADEDALKEIGMEDYAGMLQASPAGYGVMRTFSMKVHDLIFRSLKFS